MVTQQCSVLNAAEPCTLKRLKWGLPRGPVVDSTFQCRRPRLDPWLGN